MYQLGYWIQIFSELGGVAAFAWGVRKYSDYLKHKKTMQRAEIEHQKTTIESLHKKDDLLQSGVIAMLHHELYANCTEYIKSNYVTTGQLNDLEYIFRSYKALGGNGTGEILYNKVKLLNIKEEE